MRARARLTVGVAVLALAASGCAQPPLGATPAPSTPMASTAPAVPTQVVPVYFPRQSSTAIRLGRELRAVPQADPLRGAVEAMLAGPTDPDLVNGWAPGTTVRGVKTVGDVTTVDLSAQARQSGLGSGGAAALVEQLVYTVTEVVGTGQRVALTIEGQAAGDLGGQVWDAPRERTDPFLARVLIALDHPGEGERVTSPVTISGEAALYEAEFQWRVMDAAGAVVQQGRARTLVGQEFSPFAFTLTLAPGRYVVEVSEGFSTSGEGRPADTDTRSFTVTG